MVNTILAIEITSCISCLACLSIIVTFLSFKEIRKKSYVKLVFYVAVCDFLSALCLSSTVKDGTIMCWITGLVLNYSQLGSILWTDIIVWQLYLTVVRGKSIRNQKRFHFFCWGVPLFYVLLPLTTNTYGVSGGEDYGYCWVVNRNDSPSWAESFWEILFFAIVWMSIFLIFFLFYFIVNEIRSSQSVLSPYIKQALRKLQFYPAVIILCYSLVSYRFIADICNPHDENYGDRLQTGSDLVLAAQGQIVLVCTITIYSIMN